MIITGEPDHVTDLIPALCQKCPQWQKCKGTACNVERRYQVDIEIRQTLEAYDCYKVVCPKTNETLKGIFQTISKAKSSMVQISLHLLWH